MLQEKLNALQEHIAELQQTQEYMEAMVSQWRSRIAESRSGEKASLLLSLSAAPVPTTAMQEPLRRKRRR
jgi:hypothetical protein